MFGRRRHVAPPVAMPAPQLSEDAVFDIVHAQVAAAIGEHGEWTLTRREAGDTDDLFYGVVAHSVTTHVVEALRIARENLIEVNAVVALPETVGDHAAEPTADAPVVATPATDDEPAAFGWRPAPITVWTDLKKPVTGEIPHIRDHELVA